MIARLQRTICLCLLVLAAAWMLVFRAWSPLVAAVGPLLPLLGYGAVLAGEFVLLARRPDHHTPPPTSLQLVSAWWSELCVGLHVFGWRQPFRTDAVPDRLASSQGQRGVVFVHGLMCNRAFWAPWMRQAQAMGVPCMAVNLEPVFGAIDGYVPTLDAAVSRMEAATGQPPMLICHSMGGLVARAWLLAEGARGRAAHVVTIGSPHAGTWLARFGQGRNSRQMRLASDWLQTLARRETAHDHAAFTCWYSNCDNIVFPVSTAALAGADNRLVPGQAHVALAFHPLVMRHSLALATSGAPTGALQPASNA